MEQIKAPCCAPECDCPAAYCIPELVALLKAVQTDPGNWLHSDLNAAIDAAIGPAGPYRSLSDPGVSVSASEESNGQAAK